MRPAQQIKEIHGNPASAIGNNLFPLRGKMLMKLNGDLLQTQTKLNWELEYQETDIRLSKITSITMTEGRMWWLLGIGFATLWFLFGVIFIIAFFLLKQRWIVISAGSEKVILIFKEKDAQNVKLFRQTVLAAARQSGVPNLPPAARPPASTVPQSGPLRDSKQLEK